MADKEPKFMLMQAAHFKMINRTPCRKRAHFTYAGQRFVSAEPEDRAHANKINQAVEEITGIEIPTIPRP